MYFTHLNAGVDHNNTCIIILMIYTLCYFFAIGPSGVVSGHAERPTAPDLQLDWLSSSDSNSGASDEEDEVRVILVKKKKKSQPSVNSNDCATSASNGETSAVGADTDVIDLTHESDDDVFLSMDTAALPRGKSWY